MLLANFCGATTVWDASGGAGADWSVAANWTAGVPVALVPGETKAVFNRSGRAECQVTGAQSFGQLVQGDNGPGGVIRIRSGGSLSSGNNWTGIGYNRQANMIVETGGMLNCASHLWIGHQSPATGNLDISGGIVNVTGQFGIGWDGGSGMVNIARNGVLKLALFDGTRAISGNSVLDIEEGAMVINGDKTSAVRDYIAAGRIRAYGGTGTVVWEYNVTHPGKTTVTAIPGRITPNWRVVTTHYPTDDWVISPFDAAVDFGIVGDGVTDVTEEIQTALVMIANLGGGALFLPAGHYKVTGNLNIPSGVTLRGDWRKPESGEAVVGTVLMAYAGRDHENATPFITLNNSAGVNGLSIWHPEQSPADIRPYPPTIGNGGGATVENVTFVNSYWGYTSFVNGTTARPFLRNLCGTPLKLGIEFDCLADIGRVETVHFSPDYWADSGLPGAPVGGEHAAWIHENGTGMIVRRIDWSYSCYVTIEGYAIGLALRPGRHDGKFTNGQSYGFNLLGCKTGVFIEASAYAGYQFTRFNIEGAETGIHLSAAAAEATMFHSCEIEAIGDALRCDGATARVLMMDCDFRGGGLRMNHGYLSVSHSDFAAAQPVHIELGNGVRGATILGNRFPNGARIIDRTLYPVHINHTPLAAAPLPAYDFRKPGTPRRPARSDLIVVTAAPHNAQGNGVTDDTAAFQSALAAAAANGGGTVFVPGGTYRLDGSLTIPGGVELRGIFDTPNDTKVKGSLLNVHGGRNNAGGTPFIQLEAGSGVRGFTFHYPDQIYDSADTINYGMVPYPFLIRGLGADIHVINLSATIPYQLLDLATHRCDRHFVDYVFATALKTGIHVGGGSVDGQLHNCQLNPSAFTHAGAFYDSIPFGTSDDIHKILWRDATPYLFGHMTGEILHQNFVFGGWRGFHLVAEGGEGPSGHCLGMGVDQCTNAMQIDAIGSGDLQPINSQIVTVNTTAGRYLETGASLEGTFRMFSSAGWGGHEFSAVINGGDVELQLFHLARDGESGVFKVLNDASLESIGGNLSDFLAAGQAFLTIAPTAEASFTGNILNTTSGQMPANSANVTALGNLRFGAPASGTNTTWTNGTGTRKWDQALNWSGGVPAGTTTAIIGGSAADGPLVAAGTNAAANRLVVGDVPGSNDRLDVTGGALSITRWLVLGHETGTHGTLALTSGTVGVGGDLFVGLRGTGSLVMTGGAMNLTGLLSVAAQPGASGSISLAAGTLEAGSIHLSDGGVLDLTGGTLVLGGDVTAQMDALANTGRIIALGGTGVVTAVYNTTHPGKTSVTGSLPPLATIRWIANNPGMWTTDSGWTGGSAPLDASQHLKVMFDVAEAGPCTLDAAATVGQLVMGDNNPESNIRLTLAGGAALTAGLDAFGRTNWTAVGYNRSAVMAVATGANLHCRSHLWIGYTSPAVGNLDINGGNVDVDGQFGLGWESGTGFVTIRRGGSLVLDRIDPSRSISGGSSIDIQAGRIIIGGDRSAAIDAHAAAGKITSFGGAGTVAAAYDAGSGLTTVSSVAPAYGFYSWIGEWPENIGYLGDDHDGDGHNNLYEYALNGDPTDPSDQGGVAPRIAIASGTRTFSHLVRKDDAHLAYTLQTSPDLSPGSWLDAELDTPAVLPVNDDYDELVHPLPTEAGALFLRLKIHYP
jgi:hypothetical protein